MFYWVSITYSKSSVESRRRDINIFLRKIINTYKVSKELNWKIAHSFKINAVR